MASASRSVELAVASWRAGAAPRGRPPPSSCVHSLSTAIARSVAPFSAAGASIPPESRVGKIRSPHPRSRGTEARRQLLFLAPPISDATETREGPRWAVAPTWARVAPAEETTDITMTADEAPPPRGSLFSRLFGRPEPQPRDVHANDAEANAAVPFLDNSVHTTKYTLLTFLPKNLFEQFQRAANIYFLIISILTALPTSAKNPASMIGTFSFVLFISALKEAYEDYQRFKNDKAINERKVRCLPAPRRRGAPVSAGACPRRPGRVPRSRSPPAPHAPRSSACARGRWCKSRGRTSLWATSSTWPRTTACPPTSSSSPPPTRITASAT